MARFLADVFLETLQNLLFFLLGRFGLSRSWFRHGLPLSLSLGSTLTIASRFRGNRIPYSLGSNMLQWNMIFLFKPIFHSQITTSEFPDFRLDGSTFFPFVIFTTKTNIEGWLKQTCQTILSEVMSFFLIWSFNHLRIKCNNFRLHTTSSETFPLRVMIRVINPRKIDANSCITILKLSLHHPQAHVQQLWDVNTYLTWLVLNPHLVARFTLGIWHLRDTTDLPRFGGRMIDAFGHLGAFRGPWVGMRKNKIYIWCV